MTTRTLVLLVLIGSLSTSIWAQGSACSQYNTYGYSGASSVDPAVQANALWFTGLANAQAAYGGVGPTCSYTWYPQTANWYGQCFSTAWTCKPPSPPVGGCPSD